MDINTTIRSFITAELVSDQFHVQLNDVDSLIDSGIIDSFGIMALLSFIEEKFAIQISGDELLPENFESIMTISTLVAQKTGASLGA